MAAHDLQTKYCELTNVVRNLEYSLRKFLDGEGHSHGTTMKQYLTDISRLIPVMKRLITAVGQERRTILRRSAVTSSAKPAKSSKKVTYPPPDESPMFEECDEPDAADEDPQSTEDAEECPEDDSEAVPSELEEIEDDAEPQTEESKEFLASLQKIIDADESDK